MMPTPKKSRRNCLACGKECKRPPDYYCNRQCQTDYQYQINVSEWLAGKKEGGAHYGVRAWVKKYLIEQRGEQCEKCGWNEIHPITKKVPIEVDHIDGNDDHSIDNLRLLCPNCHSLTENYRALNTGRGRKHRRASKA